MIPSGKGDGSQITDCNADGPYGTSTLLENTSKRDS
mgnify:CR=1 FL=1